MLGITHADPPTDDQLKTQLTVASELIEQYCRRKFKRQWHHETYDLCQGNVVLLRNYPVHHIQDVIAYDGSRIHDVEQLDHGRLFRRSGWPCGERSISITYEAGYTLPGEESNERPIDIPKPLEMACSLYAQQVRDSMMTPFGVQSERLGEMAVTYAPDKGENNIPSVVAALIAPYKRWHT